MSRSLLQEKGGTGLQHEYLIKIKQDEWNESMGSALTCLRAVLSHESWRGATVNRFEQFD